MQSSKYTKISVNQSISILENNYFVDSDISRDRKWGLEVNYIESQEQLDKITEIMNSVIDFEKLYIDPDDQEGLYPQTILQKKKNKYIVKVCRYKEGDKIVTCKYHVTLDQMIKILKELKNVSIPLGDVNANQYKIMQYKII